MGENPSKEDRESIKRISFLTAVENTLNLVNTMSDKKSVKGYSQGKEI